ncbi:hypothetical protein HDV05_000400 [Chytridiales sp. JEL 0842]|nr:hypothetical protein HDV05_000400 [Chytridiales sp. JEL 0842]
MSAQVSRQSSIAAMGTGAVGELTAEPQILDGDYERNMGVEETPMDVDISKSPKNSFIQSALEAKRGMDDSSMDMRGPRRPEDLVRKTRSVTFTPRNHRSFSVPEVDTKPDRMRTAFAKVPSATLSRSFEGHSDWVNDILLCNQNQSLISASSDRMVYLWSARTSELSARIGYHTDYVKALAYSSGKGWVASGGLDRRIILWDTGEGRGEESSSNASIYALAANPSGTTLVSGSPDKVVRVWDPRSGKGAIGLTGHTDNIRSLLVSDDGRWILSSSSDTTVKLWSLAQPQRCMATYTHSMDTVSCLYSNHPDLETFWCGSRDGWVTKLTRRRIGGDIGKIKVDEELVDCVAICQEDGPVSKIVAVDDMFVWTSTSNKSTVNRWRDVPFRHATVVASREQIPDDPDGVYIPATAIIRQRPTVFDDDEASLKSFHFSLVSLDTGSLVAPSSMPIFSRTGNDDDEEPEIEPVWKVPDDSMKGLASLVNFYLLNNRRHVVTEDSEERVELWDLVLCVRLKDFGIDASAPPGEHFASVVNSQNTFEWIAQWCNVDIKTGVLAVHLEDSKCFDSEIYHEETGCLVKPLLEDQRINVGRWILTYLFTCYAHACYQRIPTPALLDRDYYMGALTYTDRQGPQQPETAKRNLYQFGQMVDYSVPGAQQPPLSPTESDNMALAMLHTGKVIVEKVQEGDQFAEVSDAAVVVNGGDVSSTTAATDALQETNENVDHSLLLPSDAAKPKMSFPPPPVTPPPLSAQSQSTNTSFPVPSSMSSNSAVTNVSNHSSQLSGSNDTASRPTDTPLSTLNPATALPSSSSSSNLNIHSDSTPPTSNPPATTAPTSASASTSTSTSNTPASSPGLRKSKSLKAFKSVLSSTSLAAAAGASLDTTSSTIAAAANGAGNIMSKIKQSVVRRKPTVPSLSFSTLGTGTGGGGVSATASDQQQLKSGSAGSGSLPLPTNIGGSSTNGVDSASGTPQQQPNGAMSEGGGLSLNPPFTGPIINSNTHSRAPSTNTGAVSNVDGSESSTEAQKQLVQEQRRKVEAALARIQAVLKNPVDCAPNPEEAPFIRLPPEVPIIISMEESGEVAGFLDTFRSTVGGLGWLREAARLEEHLPKWVSDVLFEQRIPQREAPKLSFLMHAHPQSNLPELPNNTNRLSSNRMIRLRKLIAYVAEKIRVDPPAELMELGKLEMRDSLKKEHGDGGEPVDGDDAEFLEGAKALVKAEYYMELVCGDLPLSPKMTLATARHLVWKSGGEMTLHYRRRMNVPVFQNLSEVAEWSANSYQHSLSIKSDRESQ